MTVDERRIYVECHDCEPVEINGGFYGTCAACRAILLGFTDGARNESVPGAIAEADRQPYAAAMDAVLAICL